MGRTTRSAVSERPVSTVAVYLRISKDDDGTSTAPQRQLSDCRRYAESKGWIIEGVYEDRDTSAWRDGVVRPQYERMLADVADGRFDAVLVYKLDRLVRRISEFVRFSAVCGEVGTSLASVNDPIDPSPLGRVIVNLLVSFAEMESANTSLRLRRKEVERAEAGEPKITGRRPYGLSADWTCMIEDEAEVIRESAARVLAGEAVLAVCRDLNLRGVPTTTGTARGWTSAALRNILTSPRTWGVREHNGHIVGAGRWPAVLDVVTGERLTALFSARTRGALGPPRRGLLSGVLRCGKCGRRLKAARSPKGQRRYVCPAKPDGCGGTVVMGDPLEEYLVEAVLQRLSSPAVYAKLTDRDERSEGWALQLGRLQRKLEELAEMFAADEITRNEWSAARRPLQERLDGLHSQMARQAARSPVSTLVGAGDVRSRWEKLSGDQRRAVLGIVLSSVTVLPARWRGEPFDPRQRVPAEAIVWAA